MIKQLGKDHYRACKCSCMMPVLGREDPSFTVGNKVAVQAGRDEPLVTIYRAKKIITMDPYRS